MGPVGADSQVSNWGRAASRSAGAPKRLAASHLAERRVTEKAAWRYTPLARRIVLAASTHVPRAPYLTVVGGDGVRHRVHEQGEHVRLVPQHPVQRPKRCRALRKTAKQAVQGEGGGETHQVAVSNLSRTTPDSRKCFIS